jgi:uncharacterized membrane protein YeiH
MLFTKVKMLLTKHIYAIICILAFPVINLIAVSQAGNIVYIS